ncbi:MAG: proline dehydrogenase family protein [Rhodospirillaceae bacterium]|nr:proline dehydrogenase family protein [Rhodospirillaceae bacterium]
MRLWQRSMIALARSARLTAAVQRHAGASALARRFVAGADVDAACAAAARLRAEGFRASLFYLGEYVADPELVRLNVAQKIAVARALGAAGLDVHVSVDPTQIGHAIDAETAVRNALEIGRVVAGQPTGPGRRNLLMLDMEDFALVEPTLALRRRLLAAGVPTGQTLQAYLRRTGADLDAIIADGGAGTVRLVKGAFAEGGGRAFRGRAAIRENYLRLAHRMLSREARAAGLVPVFATHDDRLTRALAAQAAAAGWEAGSFEFEMLYGVRPALQRALRDAGHTVRLYLPFGTEWWPYAARRVGESPRNALFVVRALAGALR